mgnify:FL=1
MNGQKDNTGSMFDIFGDGAPDLGSMPMPDPFAAPNPDSGNPGQPAAAQAIPQAPAQVPQNNLPAQSGGDTDSEPENLLSAAVKQAEQKQTITTAETLFSKLPVFHYAAATEEIKDTAITFEQLRIEKSTDFPELEDSKRVSWSMEYCGVTKQVTSPSKTVIGKLKAEIENSKEFLDALKKAKDKNPVCKVKPKITAQSKGIASYKGLFTTMEEADASEKHIRILPARDGNVYEIRCTEAGKFIARAQNVQELSEVSAGFIPALPLIPYPLFLQVIAFFLHYMQAENENEVMAYFYWDKEGKEYCVRVPMQTVSKAHISVVILPEETIDEERYVHVVDMHSHNSMPAFFSRTDDRDELATRIYMVVGRLEARSAEVNTRISVGGQFVPIDIRKVVDVPSECVSTNKFHMGREVGYTVQEITFYQSQDFPPTWLDMVHITERLEPPTEQNHPLPPTDRWAFRLLRRVFSREAERNEI